MLYDNCYTHAKLVSHLCLLLAHIIAHIHIRRSSTNKVYSTISQHIKGKCTAVTFPWQ